LCPATSLQLLRLTAHPAPLRATLCTSGGCGDAALDEAAAKAAALDLSGYRQQWAAAGALAARLASSRRFAVLELAAAEKGDALGEGHHVLMHLALCMQRASSRVEVLVRMPAEPVEEAPLFNMH
jgi:hypothetical protein